MVTSRPTESGVAAAVVAAAAARGIALWRNNVGACRTAGGGFMRFGLGNDRPGGGGSPDYVGILPGGRFIGVEVKRPGARPSPAQLAWGDVIRRAGGVWIWCDSVDGFLAAIAGSGGPAG